MKPGVITSLFRSCVWDGRRRSMALKFLIRKRDFVIRDCEDFRIYKRGVNPVNLVNPEIQSKTE